MAEQKRNSNTQKQNTSKISSAGTSQKKKRPSKAELEKIRMQEEIRRAENIKKRNQGISLVIFAVSLFLASIVFIPAEIGTLWHGIRGVVFGFFGFPAFILPAVLIYIAVIMTMERQTKTKRQKLFRVLCLSCL